MKTLRQFLLSVERRMTRRHKQVLILTVDAHVRLPVFLLSVQLVYGAFWPEAQLQRLGALFPALRCWASWPRWLPGLPRIKLKTYASLSANGIGAFAVMIGVVTFFLTLLPGLQFPIVGTITFAMMVFLLAILVRVVMLQDPALGAVGRWPADPRADLWRWQDRACNWPLPCGRMIRSSWLPFWMMIRRLHVAAADGQTDLSGQAG